MNRALSFFILSAFLVTALACSEKKITDASAIKSQNILSILRDMSQSYEKKNLNAFMSNLADGYPERGRFSSTLAEIFANYEAIHFNIQFSKMFILIQDRGQIRVSCNWDAEWLAPKGTSQKSGGRVTFVFDPGNFKLVAIDGKNPFIPVESTVKN